MCVCVCVCERERESERGCDRLGFKPKKDKMAQRHIIRALWETKSSIVEACKVLVLSHVNA